MKRMKSLCIALVAILFTAGVLMATSDAWRYPVPMTGLTKGGLIYAYDASHLSNIDAVASGYVLASSGTSTKPTWTLASAITWAGGSYTVGDILYADTTTTLAKLADGTAGYFLRAGGAGAAPAYAALNQAAVTGLTTASSPVFAGVVVPHYRVPGTTPPACDDTGKCSGIVGSDSAGVITIGATPANAFTVTFAATFTTAPACVVQQQTSAANYVTKTATTATAMVISSAATPTTSDKYSYVCVGVQ